MERLRPVGASLIVVALGCAFLWYATDGLQALTAEGARRIAAIQAEKAVPDVSLETMSGSSAQLVGNGAKVTLIEFIYTRCPTICQTGGANLALLRDRLKSNGLSEDVQIYSISFDPEYDDVSALSIYGKVHGADGDIWTITRPSRADLPNLLDTLGIVVIPDRFGGFEHNAAIHVVDRSGRLVSILDIDDIDGAVAAVAKASS